MESEAYVRVQIIGAARCGVKNSVIARSLNVHRSTVYRVLSRYRERGTVARKKGSGRPRKTSPRADRLLVRFVKLHPFSPAPLLRWRWGEPVSFPTIRRRLREYGLKQYRPPISPFLSKKNIQSRLHWAMTRCLWRVPQFKRIVWTDESRFRLFTNDGRSRVWRLGGERYRSDLTLHSSHSKGGSVHVWGAIWYGGRSALVILTGAVTGVKYCETIRTFLHDNNQLPRNWILQQDNATPHTARIVQETLEELGVAVLPWPSKSPDLNPIEHVWDFLGRRVGGKGADSLQELTTLLQQEWASIPQQYLDNLVLSMPRRIGEVIRAKGKNTRY